MIGGLIIEGSAPATVLIRARGPSMSGAPFFVPGTLANPFLQIFSGQDVIAQNDNWQDAPSCNGFVCGTRGADCSHRLRSLPAESGTNGLSAELYTRVGDSDHSAAGGLYRHRQWSRWWNGCRSRRGFRNGLT